MKVMIDTRIHPQVMTTGPPLASPMMYSVLGPNSGDRMLKMRLNTPQNPNLRRSSYTTDPTVYPMPSLPCATSVEHFSVFATETD